jgi:hypothetical protein
VARKIEPLAFTVADRGGPNLPADRALLAIDRLIERCAGAAMASALAGRVADDAKAMERELTAIRSEVVALAKSLMAPVDPAALAIRYHNQRASPVPCWAILGSGASGADRAKAAESSMRAALIAEGVRVTDEDHA